MMFAAYPAIRFRSIIFILGAIDRFKVSWISQISKLNWDLPLADVFETQN